MVKKEILFEITEENLETGMRGYPVGYCTTSRVDPKKGVFYAEKPIKELVDWDPFAVIYLLYHKHPPKFAYLDAFKKDLVLRSYCKSDTLAIVKKFPKDAHPMAILCAFLQILGEIEKSGDYREDCLNIIAKLPLIIATIINYHSGWGEKNPSSPEMGYMENFLHMLNLPGEKNPHLGKLFKLFNILHYDHGGGNLSVFTGKAVASGLQHIYGALSAAMNSLSGDRHGKANQDCLGFVQKIHKMLGDHPEKDDLAKIIEDKIAHQELIYGFGHAVLEVEDPRATIFYEFAQKYFPQDPLVKTALALREIGPNILQKNPKITHSYPNVDAISGTLLYAAGFCYPEYFTLLFALARCVGIAIQIVYERCEARQGKGTPIIRPRYMYKKNLL